MHTLTLLDGLFAVCRLGAGAEVPAWAREPGAGETAFLSVTRTPDELSIICAEPRVPATVRREGGFRLLKVEGPFDFTAVGVVSSLTAPLAGAGISVVVMSTFDTDYILVKQERVAEAAAALAAAGHVWRAHVPSPPRTS